MKNFLPLGATAIEEGAYFCKSEHFNNEGSH